jgi:hypothetical protein
MLSLGTDGTTDYSAAHDQVAEPVIHGTEKEELEALVFPILVSVLKKIKFWIYH